MARVKRCTRGIRFDGRMPTRTTANSDGERERDGVRLARMRVSERGIDGEQSDQPVGFSFQIIFRSILKFNSVICSVRFAKIQQKQAQQQLSNDRVSNRYYMHYTFTTYRPHRYTLLPIRSSSIYKNSIRIQKQKEKENKNAQWGREKERETSVKCKKTNDE